VKSLIVPLLATASFSTFLICGMVAASTLNLQYTPHKFANINDAIWTSTPMRIARSDQGLQREPRLVAAQATTTTEAEVGGVAESARATTVQTYPAIEPQESTAANIPATDGWCQARYRSYRASDNTYQPFSGGPRQQCNAPSQPSQVGMRADETASSSDMAQNLEQSHTAWCQARYSSYRLTDDTYQPLGGGERRACVSPSSAGTNG